MGLESFSTNRDNAVGDVKSRKKLENLTIPRWGWATVIGELGGKFPISIAEEMTDEELKALIKLYDEEIDEETFFGAYAEMEDPESDVRPTREDLVDILEQEDEGEEE